MASIQDIKAELNGKLAVIQFNDGSHSFLKVDGDGDGKVSLESVQLGSDVVGNASLLFEIVQDGSEGLFKLVSKIDSSKKLAFDENDGHLTLSPPAPDDATTFRFANPETTLALLPVVLLGNGQDGKLVDLVGDPAIAPDSPKFKKQLALRLINAVQGNIHSLDPDDYLAYAVSHLPFSKEPSEAAGKTFFPDLPNPILGLVNAISMNPGVQKSWTDALLSDKSKFEPWCTKGKSVRHKGLIGPY